MIDRTGPSPAGTAGVAGLSSGRLSPAAVLDDALAGIAAVDDGLRVRRDRRPSAARMLKLSNDVQNAL